MTDLIIYGAGGFAREIAWLADDMALSGHENYKVSAFVDDDPARSGEIVNDVPIMLFDEACAHFPDAKFVLGVGSPKARITLSSKVAAAGFGFASLVHPNVVQSRYNSIGAAAVICAGSILTTNIRLGNHVQINLDCTIGHDVEMEDFVTFAPGVHISGWVSLGRGAYVGTGAVIINGSRDKPLRIGAGATVGAGASVIRDVSEGDLVVGVPAKPRQAH